MRLGWLLGLGIGVVLLTGGLMWLSQTKSEATLTTPAPPISSMAELFSVTPQCDHSYLLLSKNPTYLGYSLLTLGLYNVTELHCADVSIKHVWADYSIFDYLDTDSYFDVGAGSLVNSLNVTDGELRYVHPNGTYVVSADGVVIKNRSGARVITNQDRPDNISTAIFCGNCQEGNPAIVVHSSKGSSEVDRTLTMFLKDNIYKTPFEFEQLCKQQQGSYNECRVYLPTKDGFPSVVDSSVYGSWKSRGVYWFNATDDNMYHQLFSNATYRNELIARFLGDSFSFNETHFCIERISPELQCIRKVGERDYIDSNPERGKT